MIRQALHMRIKPEKVADYLRIHGEVATKYPELAAAIHDAGIHREVVFISGSLLIVYADVTDADAYPRLFATEIHKWWADQMAPMMEKGADGSAFLEIMNEAWSIDLSS